MIAASGGWIVYILHCCDDTLYVGSTTDLGRRLQEHQAGKGAAYTRARLPVRLVHQERRKTRSTAQRREAEIKRWPRSKKLAFVQCGNIDKIIPPPGGTLIGKRSE